MNKFARIDRVLLVAVSLLIGIGLIQLYSSSFAVANDRFGGPGFFVLNQIKRLVIGLILGFAVFIPDYRRLLRAAPFVYGFSILLLIYVFMPWVESVNNTKRWASIFGFSVQVSEIAKIGLVFMLARMLSRLRDEDLQKPVGFLILGGIIALVAVLVAFEPDFSSSVFIALGGFILLFIAGVRKKHLFYVFLVSLTGGVLFINSAQYRLQRVTGFLNRDIGEQGSNWQLNQAINAIGNGGLWGQGIGEGIQKRGFVPEPHTDFILSSFAEEYGFVGIVVLFMLFMTLFVRGYRIARDAPDAGGTYLAAGLTTFMAMNFIAHTSVNVGLMPTTGIPLPFISYGGMNLIITVFGVGILLNISSERKGEHR
ncbi:MAG: FtsW/RodA/SpoVE family cell cycle protein [Fibrobacterota bacterium]